MCLPEIRGGGGDGHNDVTRVQQSPSANQTSGLRRRRAKSNGSASIRFAGGPPQQEPRAVGQLPYPYVAMCVTVFTENRAPSVFGGGGGKAVLTRRRQTLCSGWAGGRRSV